MIDIWNEEIEILIKEGITNLYWYLGDLQKSWLRAGVDDLLSNKLFALKTEDGKKFTKRQLMDELYSNLRTIDFNKRLEISRNFVRFLVEHQNFVPQNEGHRIEKAEKVALKLREIIEKQRKEKEYKTSIKTKAEEVKKRDYYSELQVIQDWFIEIQNLKPQERGFKLEKLFVELMKVSSIPVEGAFKITGEQIDGAIKYDSHFYLVELKWREKLTNQADIASLYLKAEGKMETRGLFISMEGYSNEVLQSLLLPEMQYAVISENNDASKMENSDA